MDALGQGQGAYAFGGQGNTFSMMGDGTAQGQQFMGAPASARTPYAPAGQPGEYMNPMGMNVGAGGATGGGFNAFSAGGGQWPMGMNDATAQMGMQFGKSAVAAGQDYVEKNVRLLRFFPFPILTTY